MLFNSYISKIFLYFFLLKVYLFKYFVYICCYKTFKLKDMKKVFIFSICGECGEPIGIIDPCTELGYNNFPSTNFHGELSIEETEQLRQELIQSLKDEGKLDNAEYIENNTRVMEVTFNCA